MVHQMILYVVHCWPMPDCQISSPFRTSSYLFKLKLSWTLSKLWHNFLNTSDSLGHIFIWHWYLLKSPFPAANVLRGHEQVALTLYMDIDQQWTVSVKSTNFCGSQLTSYCWFWCQVRQSIFQDTLGSSEPWTNSLVILLQLKSATM